MKKTLCAMIIALFSLLCTVASADPTASPLIFRIDDTPVEVEWESNASVEALIELVKEAPLVIPMSMYGGFEQVGSIGQSLPRDDQETTTHAGDIVLYSGSQIVVFYGSNRWAYTRLGRITDKTAKELKAMLGNGNVTITIDLERSDGPEILFNIPERTERIESRAFAGISADSVRLPDTVTEIAPDAFSGSNVRVLYGHASTYAERYALDNGFTFVPVKGE